MCFLPIRLPEQIVTLKSVIKQNMTAETWTLHIMIGKCGRRGVCKQFHHLLTDSKFWVLCSIPFPHCTIRRRKNVRRATVCSTGSKKKHVRAKPGGVLFIHRLFLQARTTWETAWQPNVLPRDPSLKYLCLSQLWSYHITCPSSR